MKTYYVYILRCSDKMYYAGITNNLSRRLFEHKNGKHPNSYTYSRRPIVLVYYCEFTDVNFAIETEKRIKKWSKVKKEALISGSYELLPNLSKKKFK